MRVNIPAQILTTILILIAFFITLLLIPKEVFAATTYINQYTTDPSSYVGRPSCPDTTGCANTPPECWNSENVGVTNCGQRCDGGQPWSKYRYSNICYLESSSIDPDTGEVLNNCRRVYAYDDRVCSTGDKCVGSEIGLRSGTCTCGGHSSTVYKYCCTTQGNPEACTTSGVTQDPYSPNEGQCPGGYIVDGSRVRSSNCVPIPPPVSCTPDPNNATDECGQTGGCTDNYPENHSVEVTPSQCTDGTTRYACSDQGVIQGKCGNVPPPDLTAFSINNACNQTGTISWNGTPYDTGSCGMGFWVDIDSDSSFSGSSYHKCFPTTSSGNHSTTGPGGFNGYNGASGPLSFQAGVTYSARAYNGKHSDILSSSAPTPNCPGSCTLSTPSCSTTSSGTNCTFTSTYSVNGAAQSSYTQRLTPDTNNSSIQSAPYPPEPLPLKWTYQPGIYTAKLDAQTNSGSSPTSCFSPTFAIAQAQTSCNITTGTVTRNASGQYNNVSVSVQTNNMNSPNVWYYNTNSTCSVAQNTCPSTPWANIQSLSSINTTHTFSWNPNGTAPTEGGSRTLAATYQNSSGQPTLKCSTNVNFPSLTANPCTMTASPNPVNTNQNTFISVYVPNLSQMPASKRSEWDIDGNSSNGYEITNDVDLSKTKSYSSTGNYNLRFRVVSAPGSSQVLSSCSTPLTVIPAGTPPGGGPICNGEANQICNQNGGLSCPPNSGPGSTQSITSQQHQDCVRRTGSGRAICVYCPPQRAPSGPSCFTPSPINGGPQVRPLPDGYSVEVSYRVSSGNNEEGSLPTLSPLAKLLQLFSPKKADASHIPVDFFRSNKMGFASQGSGSLVGTQFGNHGIYFDNSSLSPRTMYYYQIETSNGSQSTYSQTYGVSTQDRPNPRKKSCDDGTNVRLRSARVVGSTPTALTFEITFTTDSSTGSFCGCNRSGCGITPPRYLKLSSSSITAYVPWTSPSTPSRACTFPTRQCGGNVCLETEWKQQYSVALPPGTSHNFTIQGYAGESCRRNASIGSVSFSGGTSSGTAPAPTLTSITQAYPASDSDRRDWFIRLGWSPTAVGQIAKVYKTKAEGGQNRWSGTDLGAPTVVNDGGSVTYKIIDDLRNVPAGTYYYGAEVRQQNACFVVQTGQTPFVWNPPIPAWIQTTEGDVHSNTRISTPGGP